MKTKRFDKTTEQIYTIPSHVFDAFEDIAKCFKECIFENITFDSDKGILEYDVFEKHIVKPFDMSQATPEIAADMVQWMFSMLDAMANLV